MTQVVELDARAKTIEAVKKALKSPTLAARGGCSYLDLHGKRCIIGEILHDLGYSDHALRFLAGRFHLSCFDSDVRAAVRFAESKGLDVELLEQVQYFYDRESLGHISRNGFFEIVGEALPE